MRPGWRSPPTDCDPWWQRRRLGRRALCLPGNPKAAPRIDATYRRGGCFLSVTDSRPICYFRIGCGPGPDTTTTAGLGRLTSSRETDPGGRRARVDHGAHRRQGTIDIPGEPIPATGGGHPGNANPTLALRCRRPREARHSSRRPWIDWTPSLVRLRGQPVHGEGDRQPGEHGHRQLQGDGHASELSATTRAAGAIATVRYRNDLRSHAHRHQPRMPATRSHLSLVSGPLRHGTQQRQI